MITIALAATAGLGVALIVAAWLNPVSAREPATSHSYLRDLLRRADMSSTTPTVLVVVSIVLGLAVGVFTLAFTALPVLAGIAAVVAAVLPTVILRQRAHQRARLLRAVWPDIIDQLIASIRSGMGLADAIAAIAETGPAAVRPGFAAFTQTYRATGSFSTAAKNAKDLLADPTADRLLATLTMASEVGGTQLVPILRSLGTHLREAQTARHEVEARQSWVINAARLGVAAPWIVLLLLLTRPEAAAAYNSPQGAAIILSGAAISFVAYRLMQHVGRLPEEQRWFA